METDNHETMPVIIDGTLVQVPFHYEKNTGGKMVKVPELVGEFVDIKRLDSTMPEYVTASR